MVGRVQCQDFIKEYKNDSVRSFRILVIVFSQYCLQGKEESRGVKRVY